MTRLFHSRDLLTNARAGLAVPQALTCACCGHDEHEPSDMAAAHYPGAELAEAEKHYGGAICCHCFENLATCACCGTRRKERDMWSYDGPVCSIRCDFDREYSK